MSVEAEGIEKGISVRGDKAVIPVLSWFVVHPLVANFPVIVILVESISRRGVVVPWLYSEILLRVVVVASAYW
jgi:hypothetical protein